MMYSMYLSEEIFMNSGDYKIASTCSGTRTGIRGQTGRCDLAEFCDHLFEPFEKPTGQKDAAGNLMRDAQGNPLKAFDVKPTKADVQGKWTARSLDLGQSDLFKATQAIDSIKVKSNNPAVPDSDYVHGIKTTNVLAGVTDYYDLMERVGAVWANANAEIDKINAEDDKKPAKDRTLKAAERRKLEKWKLEAKRGTQFVYELRIKDTARWQMAPGGLRSTFGHDIVTKPRNYNDADYEAKFGKGFGDALKRDLTSWPEPNREATVQRWSNQFASEAAAYARYDQALADYFASTSGADHLRAIQAIDQSRVAAGC